MQNFVDFLHGRGGILLQPEVVVVFAGDTTKLFIGSADHYFFTD